MVTIKDVAARANVSQATVSRVVNNTGQVTDATRDRVARVIKELNYSPNPVARSLANNSSNTIGLMISSFRGSFFGDLMAEVQEAIDIANKRLFVTQGRHSIESEREAIQHLITTRCDGIILHARYLCDEEIIAFSQQVTIILLDRYIPSLQNFCITFDHVTASQKAVDQLISHGHTRIACITGHLYRHKACERYQGYVNSLSDHNIPVDGELVVESEYDRQQGYEATKQLLSRGNPFTAVYCCSEELAAGCMDVFRELGITVPDDISLISYDSVDLCTFLTPHISAVHFPIAAMARQAGALLLYHLDTESMEKPVRLAFEGELRLRPSIRFRKSTPAKPGRNTLSETDRS
ncbi:LacI family DNA-binding transcriptional regulator [Candidatus Sororendozoicomonas aggregata]|uniref:LacI family DNA-binding transcriptional regulator n=1 Tax=Candidatus Sororendozoicomonas aggregata TaxID=3073239 RepID=UPI002ED2A3B0